jgi:hypothetical protein
MKRFIVRYNVEFSRQVVADNEEAAIVRCLEDDDKPDFDGWDQRSTSQYEAEEIE